MIILDKESDFTDIWQAVAEGRGVILTHKAVAKIKLDQMIKKHPDQTIIVSYAGHTMGYLPHE